MNIMKNTLFSLIILATTASATPWMPWDNNTSSNNMMDSWNPFGGSSSLKLESNGFRF